MVVASAAAALAGLGLDGPKSAAGAPGFDLDRQPVVEAAEAADPLEDGRAVDLDSNPVAALSLDPEGSARCVLGDDGAVDVPQCRRCRKGEYAQHQRCREGGRRNLERDTLDGHDPCLSSGRCRPGYGQLARWVQTLPPPGVTALAHRLALPVGAQVGLLKPGLEDVPVAGRRLSGNALPRLDEQGAAAGLGRIADPAVQQGGLAAAPPRLLEGGGDSELGDLALDQHRRAGLRLASDLGDVAAPALPPGQGGEELRAPGGEAEAGSGDHSERLLAGVVELDHL